MKGRRRHWLWRIVAAALAVGLFVPFACEWWMLRSAEGFCYEDPAKVPVHHAAVVLGASPRLADGRANLFFVKRMDAAAALFQAGRVRCLIVSGDNSSPDYDEPTAMKNALIHLGVPPDRIVCDYAGLRTLDSVIRAKKIFGQTGVALVSQHFHNARALYLARANGLDAVGFDAADVPVAASIKTFVREKFACLKAMMDVHLLGTQPRHLGPPVPLPH